MLTHRHQSRVSLANFRHHLPIVAMPETTGNNWPTFLRISRGNLPLA
jgi:hypothetical protein